MAVVSKQMWKERIYSAEGIAHLDRGDCSKSGERVSLFPGVKLAFKILWSKMFILREVSLSWEFNNLQEL